MIEAEEGGKAGSRFKIFYFAADDNQNIMTLHSFVKFGGSIMHPHPKLCCLPGNGHTEYAVNLVIESVFAHCSISSPTIDDIMECDTANDITTLEEPDEDADITYPGLATFLPAPWLVNAIMSAASTDPFELIKLAITTAIAIDKQRNGNEDFNTTTMVPCFGPGE